MIRRVFLNVVVHGQYRTARSLGLRMGQKRSIQEKWSTSKGGPAFSRLFWLNETIPFSFLPTFPVILAQWIATRKKTVVENNDLNTAMVRTVGRKEPRNSHSCS